MFPCGVRVQSRGHRSQQKVESLASEKISYSEVLRISMWSRFRGTVIFPTQRSIQWSTRKGMYSANGGAEEHSSERVRTAHNCAGMPEGPATLMAYLDMYSWRDAGTEKTRGLSGLSSPLLLAGRSPILRLLLLASIPRWPEGSWTHQQKNRNAPVTGRSGNIGQVPWPRAVTINDLTLPRLQSPQ